MSACVSVAASAQEYGRVKDPGLDPTHPLPASAGGRSVHVSPLVCSFYPGASNLHGVQPLVSGLLDRSTLSRSPARMMPLSGRSGYGFVHKRRAQQCSHWMKQPCRYIRGNYTYRDRDYVWANEWPGGGIKSGFGQETGKVSSEPGTDPPSCTATRLVRCLGKQETSASSDFVHKTSHLSALGLFMHAGKLTEDRLPVASCSAGWWPHPPA